MFSMMFVINMLIGCCMVYQTTGQNVVQNEDMEALESFRNVSRANEVTISQTLDNLSQHFHINHKTVTSIYKSLNRKKRVRTHKVTNANICEMSEHANDAKLLRLITKKLNKAKRHIKRGKCPKKPLICRRCCRSKNLAFKSCRRRCRCGKWRKKGKQSGNVLGGNQNVIAFENLSKMDATSNSLNVPASRSFITIVKIMARVMTNLELSILNTLRIANIGIATFEGCTNKGDLTEIDTLNMCKTCKYNIELPSAYTPQFITHYTCGESGNIGCLFEQGICVKNVKTTRIARIDPSTSLVTDEFQLDLTACCSCEMLPDSFLTSF